MTTVAAAATANGDSDGDIDGGDGSDGSDGSDDDGGRWRAAPPEDKNDDVVEAHDLAAIRSESTVRQYAPLNQCIRVERERRAACR